MTDPSPSQRVAGFDGLYNRFLDHYDEASPSTRRRDLILAILGAVILATLASLPLPDMAGWREVLQVVVGFPAGILTFGVIIAIGQYTRFSDLSVMGWKENHSFRSRVRTISIFGVIFAAALIVAQGTIPFGLGGTIVIALALLGYNLARRTPEEIELAKQGIPDPRDAKDTDGGDAS